MRIRRINHNVNLRELPVDAFDTLLLTLVEDDVSLTQLLQMASRDALESVRHVVHLTRLGLLDIEYDSFDEQLLLMHAGNRAANDALDDARTLRPPPRQSAPQPSSMSPRTDPYASPLIANVGKPSTGMRVRPTPATAAPVTRKAK